MKVIKKILEEMDRCYSVSVMTLDGKPYVFFATEGEDGGCIAFDCDHLSHRKQIWEKPGGTMGMVQIPGKDEYIVGLNFYRLFDWEEAEIARLSLKNGVFQLQPLVKSAYLHRFDVLERNGKQYLITCTLADHKSTREDWRFAGKIRVAQLDHVLDGKKEMEILCNHFHKNHGYFHFHEDGYDCGLIACAEGVYKIIPPDGSGSHWQIRQIMSQPTSDVCAIDIDNDGALEIATIEEFHGCYFRIYKSMDHVWKQVYEHPEVSEFYHVVQAGKICGTNVIVGGCRRGSQHLFLIKWDAIQQDFVTINLDTGVGPSNVAIYNGDSGDYLFSANREIGQAAAYHIMEL